MVCINMQTENELGLEVPQFWQPPTRKFHMYVASTLLTANINENLVS